MMLSLLIAYERKQEIHNCSLKNHFFFGQKITMDVFLVVLEYSMNKKLD